MKVELLSFFKHLIYFLNIFGNECDARMHIALYIFLTCYAGLCFKFQLKYCDDEIFRTKCSR